MTEILCPQDHVDREIINKAFEQHLKRDNFRDFSNNQKTIAHTGKLA
ncbi:hypothetical protein [Lactobacillus kefiranofaciens]|uniref:Uncharacterized protein n=1 Tax=Lactobacillus kefiranofaciens TaxID=267818 RepID=A0AAX3UDP7_9LACO|nr:hypothetical protein [Lactobacillus kefiranofaciens]AEG41634.1 hypothetical protein WANG_p1031 [Lactobacillus kefiranofaciens subsp. kefiranofaciens]WGO85759.1 hypothetical protein QEJ78_10705 [Lactobacillus kefiranofaciens]